MIRRDTWHKCISCGTPRDWAWSKVTGYVEVLEGISFQCHDCSNRRTLFCKGLGLYENASASDILTALRSLSPVEEALFRLSLGPLYPPVLPIQDYEIV